MYENFSAFYRVWPRLAKVLNALGNQDKANNMGSKLLVVCELFLSDVKINIGQELLRNFICSIMS